MVACDRHGLVITRKSSARQVSPVFSVIPICTRTASVTRTGATRAAGVTSGASGGVPHEQHAERGTGHGHHGQAE